MREEKTQQEMSRISQVISFIDFVFPKTTCVEYDIRQKGRITLFVENILKSTKEKLVWPKLTEKEKSLAEFIVAKSDENKELGTLRIPFDFPPQMWREILPVLLFPISHPHGSLGVHFTETTTAQTSLPSSHVALFLKHLTDKTLNTRDYYDWVDTLSSDD